MDSSWVHSDLPKALVEITFYYMWIDYSIVLWWSHLWVVATLMEQLFDLQITVDGKDEGECDYRLVEGHILDLAISYMAWLFLWWH